MALSREQVLAADDLKRTVVKVKEWGGEVIVRTMTGAERAAFEEKINAGRGKDNEANYKNFLERLVIATAVGDDGKFLFTDADIAALSEKSAAAVLKVAQAAQKINGLSSDDVEEMVKN